MLGDIHSFILALIFQLFLGILMLDQITGRLVILKDQKAHELIFWQLLMALDQNQHMF